jgi:hypothetical protein
LDSLPALGHDVPATPVADFLRASMRTSYSRRTATKVVDGQTRPKNRHTPTTHQGYVIDRESPGKGYRHVLTKRDLQNFLDLIPEWSVLSHRLERIVLAVGSIDDGYHEFYHREKTGAIFLHAWDEDLWVQISSGYFERHRDILQRLGVSFDLGDDSVACRFTERQAKAFVLLHVFMHELGHHRDLTHQKHRHSTRGENYAERFANRHFEQLFPNYVLTFGDPASGD